MKKLLIVGVGGIGKKHIDEFSRTKKFKISVCDIDKNKLKEVEKRFENEIKDYYFYQAENLLKLIERKKNTITTIKEAAENLEFCLKIKGGKNGN